MSQDSAVAAKPLVDATTSIQIVSKDYGYDVLSGDALITSYRTLSGSKPILWPLLTPEGYALSRDYPMKDKSSSETSDHLHHRSLWFTHGEVNEANFWAEEGKHLGKVVQRSIETTQTGSRLPFIKASCDWVDEHGETLLTENRILQFGTTQNAFTIDASFTLTAPAKEILMGDTKEGTFGVRVADSIRVDSKKGGHILNSDGLKDAQTWGKAARWVDYSGPVTSFQSTQDSKASSGKNFSSEAGEARVHQGGITVLCHPSNFQFPGRWHVRTYGLFAHNPFGVKDFLTATDNKTIGQEKAGGYTIGKGESIKLRYLVVLHDGDGSIQAAEELWNVFAKSEAAGVERR